QALGLDLAMPRFRIPVQGLGDNVMEIPAFALDDLSLPLSDGGTLDFTQALVLVYDVPGGWDGVLGTNTFNTAAAVLYDPFGAGGPSLSATFLTHPDRSVPNYDNVIGFQGPGLHFNDSGIRARRRSTGRSA